MARKKTDISSENPGESVEAGVLTLANVTVKDAGRSLSSAYHRERRSLLEPFADMVREGLLRASSTSTSKMQGYMRDLTKPDGLDLISTTGELQLYNSFDGNLKNVLAVAKADKRYEDAWERLITNLELSTIDLKQQLGREVRVAASYSWHYDAFAELLFAPLTVTQRWDTYSRDYRTYDRHGMLSLTAEKRSVLSDLFFGRDFRKAHLTADLPPDQGLAVENFEQNLVADIMTLEGVALNGSPLGANGAIPAMSVKKVKNNTQISDFKQPAGEWPLDRVEMLCLTYFTLFDNTKDNNTAIDIKRLAKFAVDSMPTWIVGPIFSSFLPAMQGFTKTWTQNSYATKVTESVIFILSAGSDDWLCLDNFKMQLLCCGFSGQNNYTYLKLFSDEGIRKGKPIRKSDKEKGIEQPKSIDWGEEVGLKFAVHWIKYLCALGIVEIAMATDAKEIADDPMEGMRYAKLTPLGRYVLDIDADYTPKSAKGEMNVEFDAQNSIITLGETSPFQMFMDKVAKRISPTRFHISADTLLNGCKLAYELEQRITNLQTIIDPEKEPAIKKIIDEAKKHTFCASREGGYSLLRLRPDLQGLRELIITNKELREMTILAGPTLALVKTHKLERFNAICASNGFLME